MLNKRHGGLVGPRAYIWTLLCCVYRLSSGGKIAGFHEVELEFRVLVFKDGEKPENPEKNLQRKEKSNKNLDPHKELGQNRTQATLVEDEHSHHCVMTAP